MSEQWKTEAATAQSGAEVSVGEVSAQSAAQSLDAMKAESKMEELETKFAENEEFWFSLKRQHQEYEDLEVELKGDEKSHTSLLRRISLGRGVSSN